MDGPTQWVSCDAPSAEIILIASLSAPPFIRSESREFYFRRAQPSQEIAVQLLTEGSWVGSRGPKVGSGVGMIESLRYTMRVRVERDIVISTIKTQVHLEKDRARTESDFEIRFGEARVLQLPHGVLEVSWTPSNRPNQSMEPTATAVTPRADARVAPAVAVAHQ